MLLSILPIDVGGFGRSRYRRIYPALDEVVGEHDPGVAYAGGGIERDDVGDRKPDRAFDAVGAVDLRVRLGELMEG